MLAMIGGPPIAAGSYITATEAANTSRSKYTERLVQAGVEPSVGSVGDSYDNALAVTINGLYKAEIIHRRGPWRSLQAVKFATLGRGSFFAPTTRGRCKLGWGTNPTGLRLCGKIWSFYGCLNVIRIAF
jgi:hypothetical protein